MKRLLATSSAIACLSALVLIARLHGQEPPAPADTLPVGSIVAWHAFGGATDAPPPGWVPCDGREITDAWFVANRGAGRFAPNLNGEGDPRSGQNPGRPAFLRGGVASPLDGYGGRDTAPHDHPHPHTHAIDHVHGLAHTHAYPHQHRFDTRTSAEGGDAAGPRDAGAFGQGTRRHTHDVRGTTENPGDAATRGADPALSAGASERASGGPLPVKVEASETSAVPRHFTVTWIVKVRP